MERSIIWPEPSEPPEPPEPLLALGLTHVEGDAALVAVDEQPPQGDAVLLPAEAAQGVATRVLDLEDVRAEVAEERGDHRPGEEGGDVDDLEARERGHGL